MQSVRPSRQAIRYPFVSCPTSTIYNLTARSKEWWNRLVKLQQWKCKTFCQYNQPNDLWFSQRSLIQIRDRWKTMPQRKNGHGHLHRIVWTCDPECHPILDHPQAWRKCWHYFHRGTPQHPSKQHSLKLPCTMQQMRQSSSRCRFHHQPKPADSADNQGPKQLSLSGPLHRVHDRRDLQSHPAELEHRIPNLPGNFYDRSIENKRHLHEHEIHRAIQSLHQLKW